MGGAYKRKIAEVNGSDAESGDELNASQNQTATASSGNTDAGSKRNPYKNKQRMMVLASRGVVQRQRHLIDDLRGLLPHSVKEHKFDSKHELSLINEMCEIRNCNSAMYFEVRKHSDLYMWLTRVPSGPTIKFLVENVHTMGELKFTGNHLNGSRPFVTFDASFDDAPHTQLMKELLQQSFGLPRGHRGTKPFHDHVLSFFWLDGRVWLRHYQVTETQRDAKGSETALVEVGPRMVLQPIRVLQGSFGGRVLWTNTSYVPPNDKRAALRKAKAARYAGRLSQEEQLKERVASIPVAEEPLRDVFE